MNYIELLKKSNYLNKILFLVWVGLIGFPLEALPEEKPELIIESAIFDFGKVREGEVVSHEFVLRNNGTAVLEIENVSPT